ncbi:hypothetical protein EAI_02166 [Harpegnathos saltator]|uniref:Uncharacterized protein n=1 Tax=Harpegnathos saltator TaxID=610380 RepID=E2BLM2_HARSA|nr:hypothetical protein EAI_02166 [Harpegnathos saltator]
MRGPFVGASGFAPRNLPYDYSHSRNHYSNHQPQSARNASSYQNAQQSYNIQHGMAEETIEEDGDEHRECSILDCKP